METYWKGVATSWKFSSLGTLFFVYHSMFITLSCITWYYNLGTKSYSKLTILERTSSIRVNLSNQIHFKNKLCNLCWLHENLFIQLFKLCLYIFYNDVTAGLVDWFYPVLPQQQVPSHWLQQMKVHETSETAPVKAAGTWQDEYKIGRTRRVRHRVSSFCCCQSKLKEHHDVSKLC